MTSDEIESIKTRQTCNKQKIKFSLEANPDSTKSFGSVNHFLSYHFIDGSREEFYSQFCSAHGTLRFIQTLHCDDILIIGKCFVTLGIGIQLKTLLEKENILKVGIKYMLKVVYDQNLELVSKELNHFGRIASFF